MFGVGKKVFGRILAFTALMATATVAAPQAHAEDIIDIENSFDSMFGTELRGPPTYSSPFEAQVASLANAAQGRIGVAAVDLSSGEAIDILGSQRFPMASTSKIAVAATFLAGVDAGRWSLSSEFPLLVPVRSAPFSSAKAPVRKGNYLSARELIELMITRSSNPATDALLAVVGGPAAVNEWMRQAGITDWSIDRDIATLVRDDGAVDPARTIEMRDSATPLAMVKLLAGLHRGEWLSASSRSVLLGAMQRCRTGTRRIPALLPASAVVAHKTGSLNNTSSDVGIIDMPDGRSIAVAIYVTGQGGRPQRESRIASIAQAIYNGYLVAPSSYSRTAAR